MSNEINKTKENLKAVVVFKDGTSTITRAEKRNSKWLIGGDVASATFKLASAILIYNLKTKKIYKLQGCRLKFQDNMSDNDVLRMLGGE
jgi:hypothetical protein